MPTKLYPLKFKPILMDKIWGGTKLNTLLGKPMGRLPNIGESWELSGVEGQVSLVENGFLKGNNLNELIEIYMDDLVGERVYNRFGNEFPLLVKFIDAAQALSIQVHPGDELAAARHQGFGKTEMWYVMQADAGSYLISGFQQEVSPEAYVQSVANNTLESLLAKHPVEAGDVFFMPAGRVHAIGAGIMLAEIQQTSDITYRIYDFDRRDHQGNARELHTELAMEAIDFKIPEHYKTDYQPIENEVVDVVQSPYFITGVLKADKPVERDYYHLDSFIIYVCVDGRAQLEYGEGLSVNVVKGETVLIPAELRLIRIIPESGVTLLEVFLP
jgi:mannose-6-phosphate isomerase